MAVQQGGSGATSLGIYGGPRRVTGGARIWPPTERNVRAWC